MRVQTQLKSLRSTPCAIRFLSKTRRQSLTILSNYDHGVIVRLAARAVEFVVDPRETARLISQTKLGLIEIREDRTKLVNEYERLKGDRLDYDDLLLVALKSLQSRGIGPLSPTHMLIDEAQDLDPVQIKLIQRLSGKSPNVTFFLDYNQAIFSFKGAFLDEIYRIETSTRIPAVSISQETIDQRAEFSIRPIA